MIINTMSRGLPFGRVRVGALVAERRLSLRGSFMA